MTFQSNPNSKKIKVPKELTLDGMERYSREVYLQGRADERPKSFGDGYESGYNQGKNDAIYEFVKAINDNSHRIKDKEATGERTMLFIWEDDLKRIVKELKGQEDE